MAGLKGGALLTNDLVKKYFGTDENDYFYVELIARRPVAADFQGNPTQLKVSSKEPTEEARFKIIYNRDNYSVSHSHNWSDGGLGATVKKAMAGALGVDDVGAWQNIWSSIKSLAPGGDPPQYVDERSQFANLDVPQIYKGSGRRQMNIEFVLFRYGEENDIVKTVNDIRNLTYPRSKGDGFGGALSFAGSFRYGEPPCIWTVKCSNGAQGLKKAGCTNIGVEYIGPWVGKKGQPTYATVSMTFDSLYEMTFDSDFLDNNGEF